MSRGRVDNWLGPHRGRAGRYADHRGSRRGLLRADVERVEQGLASVILVPLTQGQYDALVSLCFNLGGGARRLPSIAPRLVAKINERRFHGSGGRSSSISTGPTERSCRGWCGGVRRRSRCLWDEPADDVATNTSLLRFLRERLSVFSTGPRVPHEERWHSIEASLTPIIRGDRFSCAWRRMARSGNPGTASWHGNGPAPR